MSKKNKKNKEIISKYKKKILFYFIDFENFFATMLKSSKFLIKSVQMYLWFLKKDGKQKNKIMVETEKMKIPIFLSSIICGWRYYTQI